MLNLRYSSAIGQSSKYETKISNVIRRQKNFGGRLKSTTFEIPQNEKK